MVNQYHAPQCILILLVVAMFATNMVAIFTGPRGRKYYTVHGSMDNALRVFYDIAFPLPLALDIEHMVESDNERIGHRYCKHCQCKGMYRNVATTLCSTCVQEFPDYVCECVKRNVNYDDYVLHCDYMKDGLQHLQCGPKCIWFAENGIYGGVNFREIGLGLLHQRQWSRVHSEMMRLRDVDLKIAMREPEPEPEPEPDIREWLMGVIVAFIAFIWLVHLHREQKIDSIENSIVALTYKA